MAMPRILFVGGGSVGHISPSVAVSEQLDADAHFICSPRKDDVPFLKINNASYTVLDAPRLSLHFLWKFPRALSQAKNILIQQQPDLVFSTGGYLSVPVCIAAKIKRIPIILLEPEVHTGLANRIMSLVATTKIRCSDVGYPIRKAVLSGSKERGLKTTGLSGDKPILLVMGGSQGAQVFNEIIERNLDKLLETFNIIHITGRDKKTSVKTRHGVSLQNGYFQTEFSTELLPDFYACADVALSRSGAGSVAELSAHGIATLFVPLHAAQKRNADTACETSPICRVVSQENLDTHLLSTLKELEAISQEAEAQKGEPEAARRIAEIIVQTLDHAKEDQ